MKKSILILGIAITTLSLTSSAFFNDSHKDQPRLLAAAENAAPLNYGPIGPMLENAPPDFLVNIDSRFLLQLTKEQVNNALTIFDIFPPEDVVDVAEYDLVKISIGADEPENEKEIGTTTSFNEAQRKLLASIDYSTNFILRTNIKRKNKHNDQLSYDYIAYFVTVVPEKEATYSEGMDALINYLKLKALEEKIIIDNNKLKPGRLNFTVAKTGELTDIHLDSSSGYSEMDKKLETLLHNLPGTWTPAEDSKGSVVDQKLVLFFGIQGC